MSTRDRAHAAPLPQHPLPAAAEVSGAGSSPAPSGGEARAADPSADEAARRDETHHTRAVITRLYEVYRQGDIPSVLEMIADEVDWRTVGLAQTPFGHACRTRDEVAAWFGVLGGLFDFLSHELSAVVVDGARAVGLGSERLRSKETGVEVTLTFADTFEVRDGKIVFYRFFTDTSSFLAALSPRGDLPP